MLDTLVIGAGISGLTTAFHLVKGGQRVAVLEDVVTTGTAAIQAARALRGVGAVVQDAIVVIDREEGGAEAMAAEGLQFWPLFRRGALGL